VSKLSSADPGAEAPRLQLGTATFLDGTTVLATTTLFINGSNSAQGEAAISIIMPTPGARTLTVQYSGDTCNTQATLNTPITVNPKATPTIVWRASFGPPASITVNSTFSVQAFITGSACGSSTAPTGTATFLDGTTVLTTATLFISGSSNTQAEAAASMSMPTAGARTLTLQYSGDACNAAGVLNTPITRQSSGDDQHRLACRVLRRPPLRGLASNSVRRLL